MKYINRVRHARAPACYSESKKAAVTPTGLWLRMPCGACDAFRPCFKLMTVFLCKECLPPYMR